MASNRFTYNTSTHRYRDKTTGRFITNLQARDIRDRATDAAVAQAHALADQVVAGQMSPVSFNTSMRSLIKQAYGAEYAFGRGGVNAMDGTDWGKVGNEVKRQHTFLDRFTAEISSGDLSAAQIRNRAGMYLDGATQAHGRGQSSSYGVEPPGLPGDGGTQCLSRCRCWVNWSETKTEIRMWWRMSGGENCPGCRARQAEWSPWRSPKTQAAQPGNAREWEPSMDEAAARSWARDSGGSLGDETFYHFTSADAAGEIMASGFTPTVGDLGRGIYTSTTQSEKGGGRSGVTDQLDVVSNVANPFRGTREEYAALLGDADDGGEALLEAGYDAAIVSSADDDPWFIVFDPRNLTVIRWVTLLLK